jgi:hypothetical protein
MKSKDLFGVLFCIIALATAFFGVRLAWFGAQLLATSDGGGSIDVIVTAIGRVTGINGAAAVLLAGVAILLTAGALALKAIAEIKHEVEHAQKHGLQPPNPVWTAITHFDPRL